MTRTRAFCMHMWILVWYICGILSCGDAFQVRKWSINHVTNPVLNGEAQRNFGSSQVIKHDGILGQSPSPSRLPSGYNVRHRSRRLVLGIVFGSLTGLAAAGIVATFMRAAVIYLNRTPLIRGPIVFDPRIGPKVLSFLGQGGCLDEADLVGVGPNGRVYKANLDNGVSVAVKRINGVEAYDALSTSVKRQIQEELQVIGKVRHRNVVSLQAYIRHTNAHLLVCDFVSKESLGDAMKRIRDNQLQLSWPMRHKIAVGIVVGLQYLHFQCNPQVTHCNLKPGNILLDDNYEPHLADFGLSRFIMPNSGAAGYVAPECYQGCRYTDKSDVFSFGVVLAVLLTAKDPTDSFFNEVPGGSIGCWLRRLQQSGKAIEALDKGIIEGGEDQEEEMLMAVRIAVACLADVPADRPSSAELAPMLTQLHSF
ncbi:hypothetical protein SUGI_0948790 [Cryptomeria japonica]|nr:hypothetical protein SUGI_0948790 [Cryptomeria japonica]